MDRRPPMLVGYARVSTAGQNPDRQLRRLEALPADRIFCDRASGKDLERPAFRSMLRTLRSGDTLAVCSMDRLARSLLDLLEITRCLQERGVTVRFLKENIELPASGQASALSRLLLAMMGAVAEFERELIRERQKEGIELARSRGVYRGRRPIAPERIAEARRRIAEGEPKAKVARDLCIGRTSLYRYLRPAEGEPLSARRGT